MGEAKTNNRKRAGKHKHLRGERPWGWKNVCISVHNGVVSVHALSSAGNYNCPYESAGRKYSVGRDMELLQQQPSTLGWPVVEDVSQY